MKIEVFPKRTTGISLETGGNKLSSLDIFENIFSNAEHDFR